MRSFVNTIGHKSFLEIESNAFSKSINGGGGGGGGVGGGGNLMGDRIFAWVILKNV